MQKVSADYLRLRESQDKVYEPKLIIDGGGTYAEQNLVGISTDSEMLHGDPQPGNAIAAQIDAAVLNPAASIPKMARLHPYVRAKGMAAKSSAVTMNGEDLSSPYASYSNETITFSASSGAIVSGENLIFPVDSTEYIESEWLPQGVFFIDTRETTANDDGLPVLSVHGYDAMLKAEQDYANNAVIGDNYDTAYVRAIAQQMGVDVDDRTWEIMQGGHLISFPLGYSCREILSFIAGIYVGCFIISDEGKLRLVSLLTLPAETNLLIDAVGDVLIFGQDAILI